MTQLFRRAILALSLLALAGLPVTATAQIDRTARGLAAQARAIDVRLATISFADTYGTKAAGTDQTASIQDGLFLAQRRYYAIKANSTALDDQFLPARNVVFTVPVRYCISSPIIVPTNVTLDAPMGISLCGHSQLSGSITNAYTGDPTLRALANVFQPMLVVPHGASTTNIVIYPHNGTDLTSGYAYGKNWVPITASVASGGTGYTVGDVLTLPQPNKSPYVAAQVIVDTVDGSGAILTEHLSTTVPGIYSVPYAGQQRYWTAANAYIGSIAAGAPGKVFDTTTTTAYVTTGGTGIGALVALAWKPDFAGGGADYNMGTSIQGDDYIGNVHYKGAGTANDATYGHQFGFLSQGLDLHTGYITGNGGYYGIGLYSTDFHPLGLHPISAPVLLKGWFGSSVESSDVVLDTWTVHAMELDGMSNTHLRGTIFHNSSTSLATDPPIMLGSNVSSTSNENVGMTLDFMVYGGGTASSVPALSCAYTRSSNINIRVVNQANRDGTPVSIPQSAWGTFGSGCEATNVFTGSIDSGHTTVLTGTIPNASFRVFDSTRHVFEEGNNGIPVNLVPSATAVATGAWQTSGSPTVADNSSAVTSPDGQLNASLLTFTTNSDYVRSPSFSVSSSSPTCASVFLKAGTATQAQINVGDSAATNLFRIVVHPVGDFINSVTAGSAIFTSYGIIPYPNGWYRFWVYGQPGTSVVRFWVMAGAGTVGTVYTYGAQVTQNQARCPDQFRAPVPLQNVTVLTSAVTIAYPPNNGTLYVVNGCASSCATQFADVVLASPGRSPVVTTSDSGVGSPVARTYTMSSGALQLAMASGTYNVTATAQGARVLP